MNKLLSWLLSGDVAIQYQTYRDLLGEIKEDLHQQTRLVGYGKRLLDLQDPDGHWGGGYYKKKWISTHYTLMTFVRLNVIMDPKIKQAIDLVIKNNFTDQLGNPVCRIDDICMNGMMLYAFCYYRVKEAKLKGVIDRILDEQMPDGGYNCDRKRKNLPHHSSLHSTISLIEAMTEYLNNGYQYRNSEIQQQRAEAIEFILKHRLFKSDKTGEIIKKSFTMLSFPPRWKYDILRALDAFRAAELPYDERMEDALQLIISKRRSDGTWPVQQKYSGLVFFDLEPTGSSSRINTLRVLRVLKNYKNQLYHEIIT